MFPFVDTYVVPLPRRFLLITFCRFTLPYHCTYVRSFFAFRSGSGLVTAVTVVLRLFLLVYCRSARFHTIHWFVYGLPVRSVLQFPARLPRLQFYTVCYTHYTRVYLPRYAAVAVIPVGLPVLHTCGYCTCVLTTFVTVYCHVTRFTLFGCGSVYGYCSCYLTFYGWLVAVRSRTFTDIHYARYRTVTRLYIPSACRLLPPPTVTVAVTFTTYACRTRLFVLRSGSPRCSLHVLPQFTLTFTVTAYTVYVATAVHRTTGSHHVAVHGSLHHTRLPTRGLRLRYLAAAHGYYRCYTFVGSFAARFCCGSFRFVYCVLVQFYRFA